MRLERANETNSLLLTPSNLFTVDPSGTVQISRDCGVSTATYDGARDKCESYDRFGYEYDECVCTGEMCNGAGIKGGASFVVATALSMALAKMM